MIEGIFVEGLIYGIMVLGVFITFRILNFPDLTVDGSFPLGAAIMAVLIVNGFNVFFALFAAFVAGVAAGIVTAIIHNRLKVPHLLAGILTMTMLWSVNIRILGNRANLPLMKNHTILTDIVEWTDGIIPRDYTILIFFFLVVVVIKILLDLFFRTDMGLTLGALGNNEQMVISQGININIMKAIGVGLSNGLVAVAGAFAAQYQGFADVGLGTGIVIIGLASVMIGEFIYTSNKIWVLTLRVLAGSIIYKAIMFMGRYYGYHIGLTPNDLKLIAGLLIIACLIFANMRDKGNFFKKVEK